jgi:tetratricopeptide (TPR) repeat protein
MIVRNEEANLPACLGSVCDLVGEMIVVDTGSTDRTREVAARLGARVHDFVWCEDFAAARNEALRLATGAWIFWLDADEWLDEPDRQRLRALFDRLGEGVDGYIMSQLCLGQSALPGAPAGGDMVVEQVRLFPNRPEICWHHRVFEQIVGGIRRLGGALRTADVVIQHPGYSDPALHRAKIERNLRLARLEHRDSPNDPYVMYTIGLFHQMLGQPGESLDLLRCALELLPPDTNYGAKLCAHLAQGHQRVGRPHEALAYCRIGRGSHPGDLDLQFQERALLREASDREGAEAALARQLAGRSADPLPNVEKELIVFLRHHLATLERSTGRLDEAETQWRAALHDRPDFALGWLELGELFLATARWDELEQVLGWLEHGLQRCEDAAVLRARGLMGRRRFAEARGLLAPIIAQAPRSLRPRLVLSQVLLLEGRDWSAAKQALLDVLALDPRNTQAMHNLAVHEKQRPLPTSGSRATL